jgi:hypothetical protein
MTIVARAPNGDELHFPDDTKDEVIDRVMKQHIVENPPPKPFGSEIPTDVAEHFAQAEVHPQPHRSLADKAVEALSGGQYGTMSDFIYNGEHPQGFMEKAENIGGRLIENAAALPVMGPIAETSAVAPYIMEKAPVLREALDVSDKAIAGGLSKAKEVTEPLYEHLKPIVAFAKNLPAKVLGTTSGVIDSKALNMAYDIGKSGDKALQKIFEEAKNIPIVNRMVYNYGRSHGLPPDVAAIAEDMTKGVNPRGLGTHDLYKKLVDEGRAAGKELHEILPKYENYKDLNIPRALQEQYAKAAGIDVGSWLPQKNLQKGLAGINAGSSLGIGNIGHYLGLLGKFATNLKLAPVLAAQSPKVVGSLAYNAGRLNRLVKGAVPLATDIAIPMAKRIAPFAKQAYEAIPESMLDTATFTTIDPNNPNSVLNQKEGGLLGKFKKKTKGYAEGGKPSLDDVALSVERAKQNIADTYDTAKDIVANPTPYLNRFRQIGSSLNDPAEPISHYLHGDISGGIARANEAFMDRSPEEIASGFAMPSGLGMIGSIENAGVKFTSPLKNTISSHKIESMPGSQWSSWLESNAPKSAKKEAEAIGLHEWAKEQPKLTKQDIHEYVDLNTPKINKTNLKQEAGELSPQDIKRLNFLEAENAKAPLGAIDDIHGEGTYNDLMRLQNIRDRSTVESLYAQQPQLERKAHVADVRGENADHYWDEIAHLTARAEALDLQGMGLKDQTRFEQYTLPGGKDYNETTLTIPKPMSEYNQFSDMLKAKYGNIPFNNAPLTHAEKQTLENLYSKHDNGVYFPPDVHKYGEDISDANRLLHYRTNVRPTENGKSALFLEELQSDWGQQGRDSGFGEGVTVKYDPGVEAYRAYDINGQKIELRLPNGERVSGLSSEEAVRKALPFSFYEKGVPHGPYVKDTKEWTQLGLKHALKDAIEQGHDYLTWTNGEQQVDRYKLSKFIKDLHYTPNEDGTYDIFASGHNGENVILEDDVPEHKLKDYVGKELAKKIVSDSGEPVVQDTGYRDWRKFSGVDLDVGSLGMKGYYDQILPQSMNDVLKQLGSKERVQNINIDFGKPTYALKNKITGHDIGGGYSLEEAASSVAANPNRDMYRVSGGVSPQMGVRITPELKQKILKEGIFKFKKGGLLAKFQK